MNKYTELIGYMKKITLSLEAGMTPDSMDLSKQPFSFQFIYGVGTEGICLLEKALFEKQSGDEILIPVDPQQTRDIFGHLRQALISVLPLAKHFYLKAAVIAIETPVNQEIVRAIAEGGGSSDCGCGCDGDCAC